MFVIESIGSSGDPPHPGMDLRMLCVYGAKERDVADFTELAARSGLRFVAVHPAGPSAIIEFTAA